MEIDSSLKRNIIGCPVRKEIWNSTNATALLPSTGFTKGFLVQVIYPSAENVLKMLELPITYTKANPDIANNLFRNNYTHSTWGATNEIRWHVPVTHPSQDKNNCINLTIFAASEQLISFYESFKIIKKSFYLLNAKNAFIHPSGGIGIGCGYFIGIEGCENRFNYISKWYRTCRRALQALNWQWPQFFDPSQPHEQHAAAIQACADKSPLGSIRGAFNVSQHDKVFVLAANWDCNFHHFLVDTLAKLSHHLLFLLQHPDILIHIRALEHYEAKGTGFNSQCQQMRREYFELLGIAPARLVYGPVLAKEVYVPRFMRCSYLLSNPVEVQMLAQHLLTAAHRVVGAQPAQPPHAPVDELPPELLSHTAAPPVRKQRTMIIQQRHTAGASSNRKWNTKAINKVIHAFSKHFPSHHIVLHNSAALGNRSVAQEILAFASADVLVGLHGAGFTSMMFMPPNSLIVEFVGKISDVHMTVCGYYGPMAAAFGHQHYIHSYASETQNLQEQDAARKAAEFYQLIRGTANERIPAVKVLDSVKVEHQGG